MNQETIEEHLTQMLEDSEREIDKVFAKRTKALLEHLGEMFRKYEKDGELSRTQIYKYNRFEKELEFIKGQIQEDYKALYKEIDKLMKEQWLDNYLQSAYVYEMATQTDMQYTIPSAEVINQAILNPIAELALSALMNGHRNEIIRKIRIELAQGIQAGESYSQIAERLENAVDFSRVKALRVARTESGRVQVEGRLKSIEQASKYTNLERFWMAELDTRTRKAHRKLDNQTADKDGYFHYKGMKAKGPSLWKNPSMDINCRCDVGATVKGKRPDVRRVKDYDDVAYQKRLAERIEELMVNEGLTAKQAEKKAKKQIYPPSKVVEYQSYDKWYEGLKNKG
jgi:SPP1 gp7 family putative phage head morphogenesis protein